MRLLLLGGPGAGKGTQAKMITKEYNIPHISTGDIFRYNIKNKTELGKKVSSILEKGDLVPDELTNEIVKDRLEKDDCKEGFVLDGYPRTIKQAEFLDELLDEKGIGLDYVINIQAEDETIVKRISGRRICPSCNADYNVHYDPPKEEGICDKCGSELIQRPDDKEETVLDRINVYKKQTEPLIDYYKKKGLLVDIDGERRPKPIFEDVKELIGKIK